MKANWEPDAELQLLLAALVDGQPTPEQLADLNRRLHQDSRARAYYVRTMSLHARLHARHATLPFVEEGIVSADPTVEKTSDEAAAAPPLRKERSPWHVRGRRAYEFFARPTPLSLAVATLSLATLLGLMAVVAPPIYRVVRATAEWDAPPPPVTVAHIADSYDPEWEAGQTRRHRGAHLVVGDDLRLRSGYVEIAFHDGVSVLLHGPAQFVVDRVEQQDRQISYGRLQRGKLTAHVPPDAVGFTVATPLVNVVDLGTQFGIDVSTDKTDVVVFEGEVAAHPTAAASSEKSRSISSGEAVRFERSQPWGRAYRPQPSQFVVLPSADTPPEKDRYAAAVYADHPVGYWQLNDEGATLAVNRAGRPHGVYRGGVAQGALPRPGDAVDSSSARFDGVDDYIEVDNSVAFNGRDFSVEVWAQLDAVPRDFASVVTSRSDRGGPVGYILYVTPTGQWQLWTGTGTEWGHVEGPAATIGQWTHVVATFQRIRTLNSGLVSGIGSLYINGELAAQKEDLLYIPVQDSSLPLRIGAGASEQSPPRYYFPGQIGEVAIYNEALLPEQVARHFQAAIDSRPAPTDRQRGTSQGPEK
jgi:hypothetical protein